MCAMPAPFKELLVRRDQHDLAAKPHDSKRRVHSPGRHKLPQSDPQRVLLDAEGAPAEVGPRVLVDGEGRGGQPGGPLALPVGDKVVEDVGFEAHEAALGDDGRGLAALYPPEAEEGGVFHYVVGRQ